MDQAPRTPRSARAIALHRLAAVVSALAIMAAAVPASAMAWVGPVPAALSAASAASASFGPSSATARAAVPAADPTGQAIYETLAQAPAPDLLAARTAIALRAERQAAAAVSGSTATSEPAPTDPPRTSSTRTSSTSSTAAPKPAPKKTAPKPSPKPTPKPAPTYSGRNHMWFPALGINHSVTGYACSASYALSYSAVYRWGCAGTNNVYLMAHAGGIFGPLYTAYYAGKLKVGMLVVYADNASHIHYFKLQWWKTTPPAGDVGWAYAAQPVSSLTLQTCVGADSSLRLVARFVEVAKP